MKKVTITLCALLLTALTFAQTAKTSHTSSESTTISISNGDHDYSVRATFDAYKGEKLKSLLIEALGKPLTATEDLTLWNLKNIYTVTFKAEKLIIDLDKDKATGTLTRTFEQLGDNLQKALGTPKNSEKTFTN